MNLRSGTIITETSSVNTHQDAEFNITEENRNDTNFLQLNETMLRHFDKINNTEDKKHKIQYIYDFYVFLNDSCDYILIPKYRRFIEAVVEKTRDYMKTLEEIYFPEITTTLEKILMFDCYFILLKVKNKYKYYLRISLHI